VSDILGILSGLCVWHGVTCRFAFEIALGGKSRHVHDVVAMRQRPPHHDDPDGDHERPAGEQRDVAAQ